MRYIRNCMFVCCAFLLTDVAFAQFDEDFEQLLRADATDNGIVDQSDAIYILNYLYNNAPEPHCLDAADANDDGFVEDADFVYIMNWLYQGGPIPPDPGPTHCGPDPTPDYLTCNEFHCNS